jgi:hypothetical protein
MMISARWYKVPTEPGRLHLSFAELGEEACKESLAQGSAKELTFQ